MTQKSYQPPPRREPGLIGKLFSSVVQLVCWLLVSLLLSIIIEWIAMAVYWPEQGANHARSVLTSDQAYLNKQIYDRSTQVTADIIERTEVIVTWIAGQSWMNAGTQWLSEIMSNMSVNTHGWINKIYSQYAIYLQASAYVTQSFVIRLALIIFSLPVFVIAAVVGAVDGLVERDLRRWGGGRESSNVYNLARKSVAPAFITACVVYISLPISINPMLVILPFAVLLGMAIRVGFERLKKYF